MKTKQQGVALIVVILSSAVLLAVILTVVTSVSVSSRRVTGDQRVMTEAQYASESGLARIVSDMGSNSGDLRAWAGLLSSLRVPSVTTAQVMQLAAQYCNLSAVSASMNTNLAASNTTASPVMLCEAPEGQASPSYPAHVADRFRMFSQYVPTTAVAPATQSPYQTYLTSRNFLVGAVIPNTQAQAEAYWQRVFDSGQQDKYTSTLTSGATSSQYRVRYGLVPVRVDVTAGGGVFSFVFRSSSATSIGEVLSAGGQVAGTRTSSLNLTGEFQIQIQPGSFAYYALLTNSQTISGGISPRVQFTKTTLYDGPVHTNGRFTFNGNPWFSDTLSSSGCESGYALDASNRPVCTTTATPGAFTSATGPQITGNPPDFDAASPGNYPQTVKQGTSIPTPGGYTDYTYKGDYGKNIIPLPTNASQQKADAQAGGIYLNVNTSNPVAGDTAWLEGLEMAALDAGGNPLNPDPAQRGSNTGAYQFFRAYRWERVSNCRAAPTGVTVNPANATIYWNQTQNVTATVQPTSRSFTTAEADPNVTWTMGGGGGLSSLGPANATTYTAPGFNTTATVTARTQYGTNHTATAAITVPGAPPPGPPAPPPAPPSPTPPPAAPPSPPSPPPSFTQHSPSSARLAQAGCTYGGPVDYNWPVFDEYRSYPSGTQMILEKRSYPDDDTNIWTFPASKPAWNTGWSTVSSSFNGVLFVDGQDIPYVFGPGRVSDTSVCPGGTGTPDCSPPAVASFARLNIVGSGAINIYGDLKYEKPLCTAGNGKQAYPQRDASGNVIPANCDDPSNPGVADNILGIYTAGTNSDINILGEGSFQNLTIHGVLMSANGRVRVAQNASNTASGADTACPTELQGNPPGTGLGSIRLLGGIIQNNYGVWGQFDSGGNITCGYGRSVTYDKRMANPAVKPPSFPTASGSTNWGLKIIRSDQPNTEINTNDPNDPASTVNAPLPVVKGTRQNAP